MPISSEFIAEWRKRESEEDKSYQEGLSFDGSSIYMGEEEERKPDPEAIIKQGIVTKKCGWFMWKKRLLRLTEKP